MLSESDKFRYLRHLMLDEVGEVGQEKLFGASVLIIGAGGLGSPNAFYLTAAGIGKIGILDFDKVDLSNLQRQILHNMGDLERFKVDSAIEKVGKINDRTEFALYYEKISDDNIRDLIKPYQFIIDATDNFDAKFLINSACVLAPLVTPVRTTGDRTTDKRQPTNGRRERRERQEGMRRET